MARVIPSQILGLHITISGKFNPMTKIMWHHHDGSIEAMGICQPLTPEGNISQVLFHILSAKKYSISTLW